MTLSTNILTIHHLDSELKNQGVLNPSICNLNFFCIPSIQSLAMTVPPFQGH